MDPNKLRITLMVDDVEYHLVIDREQEKIYRDAASRVNSMLGRYKEMFPGLNPTQYLTMVALHNAAMDIEKTEQNDTEPFAARLKESIETLDNYLKKE